MVPLRGAPLRGAPLRWVPLRGFFSGAPLWGLLCWATLWGFLSGGLFAGSSLQEFLYRELYCRAFFEEVAFWGGSFWGAPMRHFFMGLLHGASGASVYGSFARLLINGFPLAVYYILLCVIYAAEM